MAAGYLIIGSLVLVAGVAGYRTWKGDAAQWDEIGNEDAEEERYKRYGFWYGVVASLTQTSISLAAMSSLFQGNSFANWPAAIWTAVTFMGAIVGAIVLDEFGFFTSSVKGWFTVFVLMMVGWMIVWAMI